MTDDHAPTFPYSSQEEQAMQRWRLYDLAVEPTSKNVVPLRWSDVGSAQESYQKLTIDRPVLARWSKSPKEEAASVPAWLGPNQVVVNRAITAVVQAIVEGKSFKDVEGFFHDARNHGLLWDETLFCVRRLHDEEYPSNAIPGYQTHSLLSFALSHAPKNQSSWASSLIKRGHSPLSPVNALARVSASEVSSRVLATVCKRLTNDDVMRDEGWLRRVYRQGWYRVPLLHILAKNTRWSIVEQLLEQGVTPQQAVWIGESRGPSLGDLWQGMSPVAGGESKEAFDRVKVIVERAELAAIHQQQDVSPALDLRARL